MGDHLISQCMQIVAPITNKSPKPKAKLGKLLGGGRGSASFGDSQGMHVMAKTDKQNDIKTYRLNQPRGPIQWNFKSLTA